MPIPENLLESDSINYHFLEYLSDNPSYLSEINELLKKYYRLDESELILIEDAVKFTLDFFRKKGKSSAVKPVTHRELQDYIEIFCRVLNNSFSHPDKAFVGRIFSGNAPLKVICGELVNKENQKQTTIIKDNRLTEKLRELDKTLTKKRGKSIFIRRNLRRYSRNSIFIIKPNQKRYWTKSAALNDADKTYADILKYWGLGK